MDIKQVVGENIQKYRKLNQFTQEQLAEIVGLETISLSRIETGKNYPTSENLLKIAEILQVEPFKFYISNIEQSNDEIVEDILSKIELVRNDTKKLNMVKKILEIIL